MNRLNELLGCVAIVTVILFAVAPPLAILVIGFVLPFALPAVLVLAVLGAMVTNIVGWLERKLEERY